MVDVIHGNRRSARRYDCALELRFEGRDSQGMKTEGSGVTVDLSRRTLRLQTNNPPPPGSRLEVRISWPFLLQNLCRLELVVRGPVMAVNERGTIVGISNYEFQTCGERSFAEMPPGSTNLVA